MSFCQVLKQSLVVLICVSMVSCATGFPPELTPPSMTRRPQVIRIQGFKTGSDYTESVSVAFPKGSGFELQTYELPRMQAKFLDLLEDAGAADYYSISGNADYVVTGTKVKYKGGANGISAVWVTVGYFLLFVPWLFPWGDKAKAHVEVKIYDRKSRLVKTIEEKDDIIYGMWIIGFFQNMDFKRGKQIRNALLERAAARTMTAIEEDMNRRR